MAYGFSVSLQPFVSVIPCICVCTVGWHTLPPASAPPRTPPTHTHHLNVLKAMRSLRTGEKELESLTFGWYWSTPNKQKQQKAHVQMYCN